jgi:predicted dienelactone hydrolase
MNISPLKVAFVLALAASFCLSAFGEETVLRDAARNREIAITVYRPTKGEGRKPVVIFSHGAGGSGKGYRYFGEAMAKRGYVCIHPDHKGSDTAIMKPGWPVVSHIAIKKVVADPAQWEARALDIKYLLDHLKEIAPDADPSKVALAGHSMGAMTVMEIGGATMHYRSVSMNFGDPRVKAFVAISPQGPDPGKGFEQDSWSRLERPFLVVTGSLDHGLGGQPATWRREPYDRMPARDKYLLWIEGAAHASFFERFSDEVIEVASEFLDAYVKNDAASKAKLIADKRVQAKR